MHVVHWAWSLTSKPLEEQTGVERHGRRRRGGGEGSTGYNNGSFWKLPAMIPSTEWKSFVEQSKWLTQTGVKETHRGFDINAGGDKHRENVGGKRMKQNNCSYFDKAGGFFFSRFHFHKDFWECQGCLRSALDNDDHNKRQGWRNVCFETHLNCSGEKKIMRC